MTNLSRKLWRDIWRLKSQLGAIAAVMAVGITVFVAFLGMITSLEASRDAYYDRTRFADIFAASTRAPLAILPEIKRIDGVATAEARISGGALVTVPGFNEPITANVHSVPDHSEPMINNLILRTGRWPTHRRANEALVLEPFAEAHGLNSGDTITVTLRGVVQTLLITGTVFSPEYVYAVAPGRIIPDDQRFAVIWMPRHQLEAALDFDGAFNSVSLRLRREAQTSEVIRKLDQILSPYGGTGAFERADHISDRYLINEMDELRTMVRILPPIFLLISAFLLSIVTSRLVSTERDIIGLLKAVGYSRTQVATHYGKLAMLVVFAAILLGFALGTQLGRMLAELYADYFRLPFLLFTAGPVPYAVTGLIALMAGFAGCLTATISAFRLPAAEAMRPPAPTSYHNGRISRLVSAPIFDEPARMILRHLSRRPWRALVTSLGIALAMGMLTGARGNMNAVRAMLFETFENAQLQDVTVTLIQPRAPSVIHELSRLPGVLKVEPFRAVPAILSNGQYIRREGIIGVEHAPQLNRILDTDSNSTTLGKKGLMMSRVLANKLAITPGDMLTVDIREGRQPRIQLRVSGLIESYIGTAVYADRTWLDQELEGPPSINGAHLIIDENAIQDLHQAFKNIPDIQGVEYTRHAHKTLKETFDKAIGVGVMINSTFACLVIFGVVYNSARISLSERARELASLRVLGFTRREVSFVLLGELMVLVAIALPFGAGIGAGISYIVTSSFSDDLFVLPFSLSPQNVATSALITIAAAILSGLIVRRRIDQLDMVEVLKTRE